MADNRKVAAPPHIFVSYPGPHVAEALAAACGSAGGGSGSDQAVYVISGELELEVGGADGLRFTAPAGGFVRKPAGVEHCSWNATATPSEYIELNAGERFQRFVEATAGGALRAAIGSDEKYGVRINYERVPGLLVENGLTSVATMNMPWEGMAPPRLG